MLIAHISDTHVRPRGQLYQGVVDSNAMLAAAVDTINALDPTPDLIVFSGDLVDEGGPKSTRWLGSCCSRYGKSC